jgi:8-amino-7-oxononanoate synthase
LSVDFDQRVTEQLLELERGHLLRDPRTISSSQGPELEIAGRRMVNLCSNNYLGLADDPRLVASLQQALSEVGVGAGASRHVSGSHVRHRDAERRLADFVTLPSALLFATGYAANVGTLPALMRAGDAIFSDALNHASLVDGCRLSRARVYVYRHLDLDHLGWLLDRHRSEHPAALIATESVFSMEGDIAPLAALRALSLTHRAGVMVDEAHALGVVGPHGRGMCARDGVVPDVLMGTLGKSFGCSGAFIAGSLAAVRLIENRARSYVFSTAPPPALAQAIVTATDLVEHADDRRHALRLHAAALRSGLQQQGYRLLPGESWIIPVLIGPAATTMALSAALLGQGVFVHGIRPPTVPPETCRLRVTPIATHTSTHLTAALRAFSLCATQT